MAGTEDVTWVVGRCEELGLLEEQLASIDATIEETWPGDLNSGVVALVRASPDAADAVRSAFEGDTPRFSSETDAREAAQELADSA